MAARPNRPSLHDDKSRFVNGLAVPALRSIFPKADAASSVKTFPRRHSDCKQPPVARIDSAMAIIPASPIGLLDIDRNNGFRCTLRDFFLFVGRRFNLSRTDPLSNDDGPFFVGRNETDTVTGGSPFAHRHP